MKKKRKGKELSLSPRSLNPPGGKKGEVAKPRKDPSPLLLSKKKKESDKSSKH